MRRLSRHRSHSGRALQDESGPVVLERFPHALANSLEQFFEPFVGAIKHTHHPVNEEDRGNTATFRRAGAEPVILAGNGEAVLFTGHSRTRLTFHDPRELLEHFSANDIVLVEGFKTLDAWPRVELESTRRYTTDELLAILDRIWRS